METYHIETTVASDGTLLLDKLPFQAGAQVEVVVRPSLRRARRGKRYPLRGLPISYVAPFEGVAEQDWEANK